MPKDDLRVLILSYLATVSTISHPQFLELAVLRTFASNTGLVYNLINPSLVTRWTCVNKTQTLKREVSVLSRVRSCWTNNSGGIGWSRFDRAFEWLGMALKRIRQQVFKSSRQIERTQPRHYLRHLDHREEELWAFRQHPPLSRCWMPKALRLEQ